MMKRYDNDNDRWFGFAPRMSARAILDLKSHRRQFSLQQTLTLTLPNSASSKKAIFSSTSLFTI